MGQAAAPHGGRTAVARLVLAAVLFGLVVSWWWGVVQGAPVAFATVKSGVASAVATMNFAVVTPLLVVLCYFMARSWTACARLPARPHRSGGTDASPAGAPRHAPRDPARRLFGAMLLFLGVLTVAVWFEAGGMDQPLFHALSRCGSGVLLPLAVPAPVLIGRPRGAARVSTVAFAGPALAAVVALGTEYAIGSAAAALTGDPWDAASLSATLVSSVLQSVSVAGLMLLLMVFASGCSVMEPRSRGAGGGRA